MSTSLTKPCSCIFCSCIQILHVQGENGAGKTSLLRACAGLISVSSGKASVLGFDMRVDRKAPRRHIGLLGHENNLYRDLEVSKHVEFRAASVGARARDTAAALEKVRFPQQLWSVPIGSLSAGQRRKVAIASLLVGRPQLWLLDEPHAALDTESRKNLDAIFGWIQTFDIQKLKKRIKVINLVEFYIVQLKKQWICIEMRLI